MEPAHTDLHLRLARLLGRAVHDSGRSLAEVARRSELKRDTVRRTIEGAREVTIAEAVAILDAAGLAGEQTLLFMLLVDEDFAMNYSGTVLTDFIGELFRCVPSAIVEELGENAHELRPRWAHGTAKLLATPFRSMLRKSPSAVMRLGIVFLKQARQPNYGNSSTRLSPPAQPEHLLR